MKHIFLSIIFLLCFAIAQAQQITNVQATQDGDNVNITYNITGAKKGQTFDIEVKCSTDGGSTFTIFPASVSGDSKGVTAGDNKQIIWNVLQDRDEIVGENIVFELTATVKGGKNDFTGTSGIFTDERDGHVYKWVKIGKQIWMAENLAYKADNGCWAFENNSANAITFGYLYTFETAQKVCPKGWHLPSDVEWQTLEMEVGLSADDAQKTDSRGAHANALKKEGSYGFDVLFCGGRNSGENGTFFSMGYSASFWTSTIGDSGEAWSRNIYSTSYDVRRTLTTYGAGFSIRCVKD